MARPASRKAVSSLPAIANIDEQLDEVVMGADRKESDESLEQDAARYRWLRSNAIQEGRDGGYVQLYSLPSILKEDYSQKISHKNLDEAIDAKIAGK